MNVNLENDLRQTMKIISANWNMQNNRYDNNTNFIYNVNSLSDCLIEIEKYQVDKEYALHRWYNYMTSIRCEYIFCEFGAIHDNDKYNHDVDIYINSIPFDVKLTVYPAKLYDRPYNLSTRVGKNNMIKWYYAHQSQENRKQMLNRLYVVCDAPTSYECMAMKSNFDLMRKRIQAYMAYIEKFGMNEISIEDNGNKYTLISDIILLN